MAQKNNSGKALAKCIVIIILMIAGIVCLVYNTLEIDKQLKEKTEKLAESEQKVSELNEKIEKISSIVTINDETEENKKDSKEKKANDKEETATTYANTNANVKYQDKELVVSKIANVIKNEEDVEIAESDLGNNLLDMDDDGIYECFANIAKEGSAANYKVYSYNEKKDEVQELNFDLLVDSTTIISVRKHLVGENKVYTIETAFADGKCYHRNSIYTLKKSSNTISVGEKLFEVTCDQEKEEKNHEEDNHVDKYLEYGKTVVENKFNEDLEEYKSTHLTVKTIFDLNDFGLSDSF